jgi:predicted nucleic acid-binding protein
MIDRKIFDVEFQWRRYCEMVKLPPEQMSLIQRVETRRAFFGAWGQLLVMARDELGSDEITDDEAVELLEKMTQQVKDFFEREVADQG